MVIGAALSISRLVFEVPTGMVADLYSRCLSGLIGLVLIGLAMIVEDMFPSFLPILLAQVIWGLGYTFTSGANEAWLLEPSILSIWIGFQFNNLPILVYCNGICGVILLIYPKKRTIK